MGKALLIAEKNSVAQGIAEALNATKKDIFWESEKYIIAYCNGHLVRNLEPWEYDRKYKRWSLLDLPFIPDGWVSVCDKQNRFLLDKLGCQAARKDVTSLVCATDPEREGELIFREILDQLNSYCINSGKELSTLPVYRLWLSSVEPQAVRHALENLKSDSEYDGLYYAAVARNHSDWLVGMNLSRFYSVLFGHGKITYNVGRLITPLVCEIVRREKEISQAEGKDEKAKFIVRKTCQDLVFDSEPFSKENDAKDTLQFCAYSPLVVKAIAREDFKIKAPRLYSLTALQQKAFEDFGFEAARTLDVLQGCYEKRLLSYPRTDSSYIDEKTQRSFDGVLSLLCALNGVDLSETDSSNVVNSTLVSGHPALLVTHYYASLRTQGKIKEKTTADERRLLKMIERRMVMATMSELVCTRFYIQGQCSSVPFSSRALVVRKKGFLRFSEKLGKGIESCTQADGLFEGLLLKTDKTEIVKKQEEKIERYNDATLLSWMTEVGKDILPQDMIARGLGGIGRSSTRAEAIERIIESGYVKRVGTGRLAELAPTDMAFELMEFADRRLCDENTTAMWELQLQDVENLKADAYDFVSQTEDYIRDIIARDERTQADVEVAKCPLCQSPMIDGGSGYFCTNEMCGLTFYRDLKYPEVSLEDKQMKDILNGEVVTLAVLTSDRTRYYKKDFVLDESESRKWKRVRIMDARKKEKKNEQH